MRTSLGRIVLAYAHELGRRVKMLVDPPLRVPVEDLEAQMKAVEAEIDRAVEAEINRWLEDMAKPRVFVRLKPCTRRTWCTLREHSDDVPCVEVPREKRDIAEPIPSLRSPSFTAQLRKANNR